MKTTALLLPCLFALAARAAPAQAPVATVTVVVQGAATDVVLNRPLVAAIVNEPACKAAVAAAAPAVGEVSLDAGLPATHAAGTFQIEVQLSCGKAVAADVRSKAIDAVVAHLLARLDAMLVEQPRQALATRCAELAAHHRDLQGRLAELRARGADAPAQLEACHRRAQEAQAQLASAELELAIEERTREQLELLRREHEAMRTECGDRLDDLVRHKLDADGRVAALAAKAADLGRRPDADAQVLAKLQDELRERTAQVQSVSHAIEQANARTADVQRMLSVVLEQVPANTLALQRARVRLEVFKKQLQDVEEQRVVAGKAAYEAAQLAARSEEIAIDLSVVKTLLLEGQSKLARLAPLQVPDRAQLRA
ncbi:MAG: hypothetical protein QM775_25105 [Pirellulales bacterium]